MSTIPQNEHVVNRGFTAAATLRKAPPFTRLSLAQFDCTILPHPTLPRFDLVAKEPLPGGRLTCVFAEESAKVWRVHNERSPLPPDTTIVLAPADSLSIDDMNEILADHDPLKDGYLIDIYSFAPWHRRLVQQLGNPHLANLTFISPKGEDHHAAN